jgi:hypothetical protein
VLLIAAGLTWSHLRKLVPESELAQWLSEQSAAGLVINRITKTVVPQSDGSNIIKFDATGTVPAALFVRENTATHLRRTLNLSHASSSVTRAAIEAAADPRVRERAGVSDTPADPLDAVVLRETTAAGTSFPFSGVATASRVAGKWRFTLLQGTLSSPTLEGQPRARFGEKTFVIGSPADDAALKELVEKQNDFVTRLEKARDELAVENKRDRESRLVHFHNLLSVGTLFTGETTSGEGEPVSLEIAYTKPGSRQVSALLRNSGGWSDARPFLGTWKFDDATGAFSLNLMSRSNQAIPDAGPLLANSAALSLSAVLSDDGRLTSANNSDIALALTRVDAESLAATKAKLTARLDAALEATRADTIYHGTATAKKTGASEHSFLRFTQQTDHGASLTASLESAEAGPSHKRTLRGAIVDNRHRAGDQPIRLQLPGSTRARSAKPGTLFAHATDATLALKVDGTGLLGEDATFRYEFTRITAQQAAVLKKAMKDSPLAKAAASTTNANLPRTSGVHIQIDGQWTALPRNGGSTSQGLGGFAKGLFSKNKDAEKAPTLVFKGNTPVPIVPGDDLTLTFKGKIPSRPKGVPADYPLIEAAHTTQQDDGTRSTPLERITSNFAGFGTGRLSATVAQPAADILTLTFVQRLEPGTYAILVGTDGYEFTVK